MKKFQKKIKEEDVRKKLACIEDGIDKLDDMTLNEYLKKLKQEIFDQDMFPLRRKMWRTFLETESVSVSADIEFSSKELLDKYYQNALSIANCVPTHIRTENPFVLHYSFMEGQESRFRKELNVKILFKAGKDRTNIAVKYNHMDSDIKHKDTKNEEASHGEENQIPVEHEK